MRVLLSSRLLTEVHSPVRASRPASPCSVRSTAARLRRLVSRAAAAPAAACTNICLTRCSAAPARARTTPHLHAGVLQPSGSLQLGLQVSSRSVHADLQVLAVLLESDAFRQQVAVSR